jgi:hypothetical protein
MASEENKLIGYKAIAQYLDMSIRNVRLWEKNLGLPLHRISGHHGYRIHAFKDEIDQFVREKDGGALKKQKHKKIVLAVILSICTLIITIGLVLLMPGSSTPEESDGPATFNLDKTIVQVLNANGDLLWKFNYGNQITESDLDCIVDKENIDDDPQKEVVACIFNTLDKSNHAIMLFDHDGRMIWRRNMNSKHTFDLIEIDNLFRPMPVKFARTKNNDIRIISKWVHMDRFLSVIASHNLHGEMVDQYFHTGHVQSSLKLIDLDGDGIVEIVFGGTNNLLSGEAIAAALPLEGFSGMNPPNRIEPEFNKNASALEQYIADQYVPGNEIHYLRFKKTGYLDKYNRVLYNSSDIVYEGGNIIQFKINNWHIEPDRPVVGFYYLFDKTFTLVKVYAPGGLQIAYPRLLFKGDIDITLEQFKKIYSKIVYRWENGRWAPVNSTISD